MKDGKEIRIFNTMGREMQVFQPIKKGLVKMYCCGPTVYAYAHIGNYRTYLFEDMLRRMFEYNGYKVEHVMNITDVGHLTSDEDFGEDKVEISARKSGKTAWDLVKVYEKAFLDDLKKLNIKTPNFLPRATDHIHEQIEMVKKLEENGFTYKTSDGLYFDVSKLGDYGKLSGQKIEEKQEGARVEVNKEKRNPSDFALWKFTPDGQKRQMEWDSPWGKGFPGWHIECSAMSTRYLGNKFDIHCGGVDHIAVHHENEIAQTEAANGHSGVKYWMHGEFMMVDGKRMGKSEGNAYLISDFEKKGIDPTAYRYLNLGTHYRVQLNFTWESLLAAETALKRLRNKVSTLMKAVDVINVDQINQEMKDKFWEAINNDLNLSEALSYVWELIKSDLSDESKIATIRDFDEVLGLDLLQAPTGSIDSEDIPAELKDLLKKRAEARRNKDFALSDSLRDAIQDIGYMVKDTSEGQILEKK